MEAQETQDGYIVLRFQDGTFKEMPPNNLRKPVAKFTDFIRFTLNKMRRLFSGSS